MAIFAKRWGDFLETESFNDRNLLKLFLLAAALMILLSYATTYKMQDVIGPRLCSSCHQNMTVAQAMLKGNHARFSCETCHGTQGLGLFPKTTVPVGLDKKVPVDREICQGCHVIENRVVTPHIPIKVPHKEHLAKGLQCVDCHKGVVHGEAAEKRGTEVMVTFKNNGIRMPTCIKCHLERGVSTKCSWCHLQDLKPGSHNPREKWVAEGEHGQQALKDVGVCQMCHSYTKDKAVNMGRKGFKAAEFARSNAFCSGCHVIRPPRHVEIWPIIHKQQAIPQRQACLVCHNEEKPKPDERVVQRIYCFKCHRPQDSPTASTSYEVTNHPENWRQIHPSIVKSIGITEGRCFQCHASNHCAKCHRANNIHQIK